jgi:putative transcriptional regulator
VIRSNLKRVRADKELADGRKLTYATISAETGLSQGVLVRLMNGEFERVEVPTLNTLCRYFGCTVGELLEYIPDVPDPPTPAG